MLTVMFWFLGESYVLASCAYDPSGHLSHLTLQ